MGSLPAALHCPPAHSMTPTVTHAWDSGSCHWTNLEEMPNWLSRGTTEKGTGVDVISTPEVTASWDQGWALEDEARFGIRE